MSAMHSGGPLCMGVVVPAAPARASLVDVAPPALSGFCRELAAALDLAVEARTFHDYASLLAAIAAGELHLAWLPPLPALQALRAEAFVPVAAPVRGGATSHGSALFTRASSPIRHVVELDVARAGWVDAQSTAGYLVIRASLRARGIDLRSAFGQELFLGSHDAVVDAVVGGDVDVGATFVHFSPDGQGVLRAGWGAAEVRVLALAGPIPADMLAARADLSEALRRRISDLLLGASDEALPRAARGLLEAEAFAPVEPEHLEALAGLADHLEVEREGWASTMPPPTG